MGDPTRPTGFGGEPVAAPAIEEVRAAAARIADLVVRTPLLVMRPLEGGPEQVRLKPETLQPIGSFKVRGALNWALQLSEAERARGLATVSAGNTAQALGYAAWHLGVAARSRLPETTPEAKLEAIRGYGVEPVLMPGAQLFAWMLSAGWHDEPQTFLHPWVEPRMIAGSATVGLEIAEDWPDVETVYVPVGGGGLIGGVGAALRALCPDARIVGVQPEACAPLRETLAADAPRWVEQKPSLCDGLGVPLVTDEMFPLLREVVDETAIVTESEVAAAIRRLALSDKLVVEGGGAASVAAALKTPLLERGRTVCILSGASIDAAKLARILTQRD